MDEARFWSMIEDAWKHAKGSAALRERLAAGELDEDGAFELQDRAVVEVVPALQESLEDLAKDELLQFDRILERKLFDIDRADIQARTDGSDDGFLYARGFIVAAGRAYYEAVTKDPSRAMAELECEDLCYLPLRVYEERFGEMPDSGISRESGSNAAGWAESED
ncbi:MAG TPA: DUF4240 domain-containing protein [Humisphaera sp.]